MKVAGGASKKSRMKYFAWTVKATAAPAQPGKFKHGLRKTSEKTTRVKRVHVCSGLSFIIEDFSVCYAGPV